MSNEETTFRPLSIRSAYYEAKNELEVCALIIADSCTDDRWGNRPTEYQLDRYRAALTAFASIRVHYLGS